jgi:hypothetical protein
LVNETKPRQSRLAVACLLLGCIPTLLCSGFIIFSALRFSGKPLEAEGLSWAAFVLSFSWGIGGFFLCPILGIPSIVLIRRSHRTVYGVRKAILGICAPLVTLATLAVIQVYNGFSTTVLIMTNLAVIAVLIVGFVWTTREA